MKISTDIKLDYSDVLIVPKKSSVNSRKEVSLEREFKFLYSPKVWSGIPIIAANMDGVGTFEIAYVLQKYKLLTCIVKHYSLEDWEGALDSGLDMKYTIISSGVLDSDLEKLDKIIELSKSKGQEPYFICLDVANGYTDMFVKVVENVRKKYPDLILLAGNVVTEEITVDLVKAGADIVKVGIGSGSVCTTRLKAGVGYPQLSAVLNCSSAAHDFNAYIVGDGGCVFPADVSKGLAAGSDFIMLGGMLAGHDEGGIIGDDGLIPFYGMSSTLAMEKHYGEVKNYRSSEGREVYIESRGSIEGTIIDILGSIRSSCTYIGVRNIKDIYDNSIFIKVSRTHNAIFER